jgi:hypothetical protein
LQWFFLLRRGPENHESLGTCYHTTFAEQVDDAFEVVYVLYPDPCEGVRIAGYGEDGFDFGNVVSDTGDCVDWGFAGEAEFAEGLKRPPKLGVVEPGGEAQNDASLFQAVNSALDCGSGEADLLTDIAESSSRIQAEELENCVVCLVEVNIVNHATNLLKKLTIRTYVAYSCVLTPNLLSHSD